MTVSIEDTCIQRAWILWHWPALMIYCVFDAPVCLMPQFEKIFADMVCASYGKERKVRLGKSSKNSKFIKSP